MSNFGLFQFLCDFFSTIIPYCYVISRFFCTISENILERYSESILCIEAMQLGEERKSVDRMWIFVIVVIPPNFRKKLKLFRKTIVQLSITYTIEFFVLNLTLIKRPIILFEALKKLVHYYNMLV